MSIYASIREMKKMLSNMNAWFDKAVAFAGTKKFEPDTMLAWRLAPDMFTFCRQVQASCDGAKFAAARVTGKEPPSHPDTETTLAELRQRIANVIAYLDTFTAKDFEGAEERVLSLPRWEGKKMLASDHFFEQSQPNFYFHVAMVYALLRNNGVDVGKLDYLGPLPWR